MIRASSLFILLSLSLSAFGHSLQRPRLGAPRQKRPDLQKRLYEQYPELKITSAETDDCSRNFNLMLMNITQSPYNLMTMYGTWHLNDLGSYT